MLQLANATPFAAKIMLLGDQHGIDTLYTVVKATFALGEQCQIAEQQLPVTLADEFYGDPLKSSIRVPSDIAIGKVGTDVLVCGTAWAPGGEPSWQMDVSVSLGSAIKRLRVFGDRVWESGGTVAWIAPFTRMPLVWERAFGGRDESDHGPFAEPRNPVGIGFRAPRTSRPVAGMPLPNVEDPASLMSSPSDEPSPAGVAPLAPYWLPRRSYAGTYDESWQKTRAPYLPLDFDLRFCHLAPAGLSTSAPLEGGEVAEVRGMTPAGVLRFALPNLGIQAVYDLGGQVEPRPGVLDTVIIEPDANRLALVWRVALPCDKKVLKVREVAVEVVDRMQSEAA